jgi:NADPH:quinone reductase-like Zn-dependent oxidoreductase
MFRSATTDQGLRDYNFGIPTLPYVAGREFAGVVVRAPNAPGSRVKKGDVVAIPSTDYRDLRKAAFQQYSVASSFNAIRLPSRISINSGSILGVAFVSAALALGICMGLSFQGIEDGPDLLNIVRKLNPEELSIDIRQECLQGIAKRERAKSGDFLVIWGGSSTCAHVAKQIARLAGMRIVSVVDSAKHGLRVSSTEAIRPHLVVDSHDPQRAVDIIKASTSNRARFGLDTIGKETAGHLLSSLALSQTAASKFPKDTKVFERSDTKLPTPPATPLEKASSTKHSHLVGLTGLPKTKIPEGVALHSVPIKLFHEIPEVGEALSAWCERLLVKGLLVPPDVVGTVNGLGEVNEGLDRMRRREVSGGRIVAVL